MKKLHISVTEKHMDFLMQEIGTDNVDNFFREIIEREINNYQKLIKEQETMERVENGSRKQY